MINKVFADRLNNMVRSSKLALKELDAECFNSDTLRQFYTDKRFFSEKPDEFIVKSRYTGEPVKIWYKLNKIKVPIIVPNDGIYRVPYTTYYKYNFYNAITSEKCGTKLFGVKRGIKRMVPCRMKSEDDDLVGVGIREDECQIREAIRLGLKSIPRISRPESTLFHLKMGFKPVPDLHRIHSLKNFYKMYNKLTGSFPYVDNSNFIPIVREKKGLFGKKYYLDFNATISLANMRIIKKELSMDPAQRRVKPILTKSIDMKLSGKEFETWKNLIDGKGFNATV